LTLQTESSYTHSHDQDGKAEHLTKENNQNPSRHGKTRQCIVASTVFVDHASDFSYVYHQTSMTSEETLKSKLAFEKFALSHGVHIKHFHADNGRFKDNQFTKSIEDKGQTISFCGVGAHHQNGIAEKRIGDLQRRASTKKMARCNKHPSMDLCHQGSKS
jgi:transposase InsO family protein